jgi:hypothetical protein
MPKMTVESLIRDSSGDQNVTSRRQFLQSSIAVSGALCGAPLTARAAGSEAPRLRLELFVLDRRFPESVAAAKHAAERGVALAATEGDLTSLWYHDLDLRWQAAPMTLAGVTTRGALFVLETFAADRGMRVLYRGEHALARAGAVVHTFAGPSELVAAVADGAQADWQAWPLALGHAMTHCSAARTAATRLVCSSAAASSDAARGEPLFSWIIAPRSNVGATV